MSGMSFSLQAMSLPSAAATTSPERLAPARRNRLDYTSFLFQENQIAVPLHRLIDKLESGGTETLTGRRRV